MRRRRFTEEVEPAETDVQEAEAAPSSEADDSRTLDLMA